MRRNAHIMRGILLNLVSQSDFHLSGARVILQLYCTVTSQFVRYVCDVKTRYKEMMKYEKNYQRQEMRKITQNDCAVFR